MLNQLPSIYDLIPAEEGGTNARIGFEYQDHVAAGFCIQMLTDPNLAEIWCETEDDVTLLWIVEGGIEVEFVQVKANEVAELWSASRLCADAPSILEKSIKHDRCAESCTFRIITKMQVNQELQLLTVDRAHDDRNFDNKRFLELHKKICSKLSCVSPKGRSVSNWLSDVLWQVGESEDALQSRHLLALTEYVEQQGEVPYAEQMRDLYQAILKKVRDAGCKKWRLGGKSKKIKRSEFLIWLSSVLEKIKGATPGRAVATLKRKLTDASISSGAADQAEYFRRIYRAKNARPVYQESDTQKRAEEDVIAELHSLLASLDAGLLTLNGPQFHARCLDCVKAVHARFPDVSYAFLQGAMYSATARCRHRFVQIAS